MVNTIQVFCLLLPLVSFFVFYNAKGKIIFRTLEFIFSSSLSILCIGAYQAGDFFIATTIVFIICLYLFNRYYTNKKPKKETYSSRSEKPNDIDYSHRVKENIKKLREYRDYDFPNPSEYIGYVSKKNKNNSVLQVGDSHLSPKSLSKSKPSQNLIPTGTSNNKDFRLIAFDYEDNKGDKSYREVDVRSCDGTYIHAYCHNAGAMRTFRMDRIQSDIIIRATGEIVPHKKWLKLLRKG